MIRFIADKILFDGEIVGTINDSLVSATKMQKFKDWLHGIEEKVFDAGFRKGYDEGHSEGKQDGYQDRCNEEK